MADVGTPSGGAAPSAAPQAPSTQTTDRVNPDTTNTLAPPPGGVTRRVPEPEPVRKYKVKVDGEESEVEESELVKSYERRQASYKRFEESAKRDRQARSLAEAIRDRAKVVEVLRKAGHDPRELAEDILADMLAMEQLPPMERQRMQLEQERKAIEAERKAIQDARAKEQFQRDAAAHEQNFTRNFKQALTATKMNPTPWAMRRMATLALEAGERGIPVTYQDLAEMVRDEYREEAGAYVKDLDVDTFEQIAGDRLKALRQRDLEKLRATPPGAKPATPVEQPRRDPQTGQFQPQKKLHWKEAFGKRR